MTDINITDYLYDPKQDIKADLNKINEKLDGILKSDAEQSVQIRTTAEGLKEHKDNHWKFFTGLLAATTAISGFIAKFWK